MVEPLIDRLTHMDEQNEEIIDLLQQIVDSIPDAPPHDEDIAKTHLYFYDSGTLAPDEPPVEYDIVRDDEQGFGIVGRSGWISNDGVNALEYAVNDGDGWGRWVTLGAGGVDTYRKDNDVWFSKIKFRSSAGTSYSFEITR